jgi:hypothetical protein
MACCARLAEGVACVIIETIGLNYSIVMSEINQRVVRDEHESVGTIIIWLSLAVNAVIGR